MTNIDGQRRLHLFKRTDPLEIPLGGDEPAAAGPPHLLLLVDSSGSMKFKPTATTPIRRGKYDIVLKACYGIFKHIERNCQANDVQVACINFSGRSIESDWHPFHSIEKVKRVLLTYQGGGTTLSAEAIRRTFEKRPGKFLAIAITDGCIRNVPAAAVELRKIADADCNLVLLHVGTPNDFTRAVREINGCVHIVNRAEDLIGLSLQITKEQYAQV